MIEIRREEPKDIGTVRKIHDAAFGQPAEGFIVDTLRKSCNEYISLVALSNGQVVGHILFTPVTIDTVKCTFLGMGLAPMAVFPQFQQQGIGSKLVIEGLRILQDMDIPFVIVLGHEGFYPRFGFEPASKYGITCQWEGVPDNVFMIRVLNSEAIKGISGTARYRDEFNAAM